MHRKMLGATLALLIIAAPQAYSDDTFGSVFGTLATAHSMGQGVGDFGFAVGIADATSIIGSFSYGMSQYTDGRAKIALVDADNADTKIAFGADFKWQFWSFGTGETSDPFDMALGGMFEYVDVGPVSAFQVGGQWLASYPVLLKNNRTLSPYGRFNIRLESASFDNGVGGDDSSSNIRFGLNGGVAFELTDELTLFGEFQIDGNDGVFFGLDFNVM